MCLHAAGARGGPGARRDRIRCVGYVRSCYGLCLVVALRCACQWQMVATCTRFALLALTAAALLAGRSETPDGAAAGCAAIGLVLLAAQGRAEERERERPQVALYKIHPKHQKSVKNNILSGITLGCWISLLWRRAAVIEWACYWPRICFLSFMACVNSVVGCVEWALYSRAWRAQPLPKAPVFILGHPRTGTTLLHNMLSRDQDKFIYCSERRVSAAAAAAR